jgi:hypothetical protein
VLIRARERITDPRQRARDNEKCVMPALMRILNNKISFKIVTFVSISSILVAIVILVYNIASDHLSYRYKYGGMYEVDEVYVSDSTDAISMGGLMYLYEHGQCKTPWRYGLIDSLSKGTWGMLINDNESKMIYFNVSDTVMSGEWRIHNESLFKSSILRSPYVSNMTICNSRLCIELLRRDRYFATAIVVWE